MTQRDVTQPVVEVEQVTYRRMGRAILTDVSWTVRSGEHWALLGANGSGKTSLLKLITGYEWASQGSVSVLGQRFGACNIPQLRKRIGWVSSALQVRLPASDPAIRVVASGYEASLGVYRRITAEEMERARQALVLVGAEEFADRPYGVLSQGEQQRTLIARAIVNQPSLLILDEPCAGLDPASSRHFLNDLAGLAHTPNAPSIVLVTHHVEEIGAWINRVMVLKAGAVHAQGNKNAVLTSAIMTEAFGEPCHVDFDGQHFWLRLLGAPEA